MRLLFKSSLTLITLGVLLGLPTMACAEQRLQEFEGAPFSVAAHPKMVVQTLAMDSPAGFAAAAVLPQNIAAMDLVQITWPKSKQACVLTVAMTGARFGQAGAAAQTFITLGMGQDKPQVLPLPPNLAGAMVSRVCVWPSGVGDQADLVILLSLVGMDVDSPVIGFQLAPGGTTQPVDTGKALTLFGWFDARDLDDNGTYELITSRSLDGIPGGFFYHAVRTYDAATRAYLAQPDSFRDYFKGELTWLNWVVDTRALIQADPAKYLDKSEGGSAYVAEYEGVQYIFDSVIEVPPTVQSVGDVEQYNNERRQAFGMVQKYRDELQGWLDGGANPATWKLAK